MLNNYADETSLHIKQKPCIQYHDKNEIIAITALRNLYDMKQQNRAKSNTEHTEKNYKPTLNRLVVHLLSLFSVMLIWVLTSSAVYYYLTPYVQLMFTNTQTILKGSEDGTMCSVWNQSPYQQAKCALISHCSYMMTHFISSVYSDMQKMQSIPTLFAYLFSTVCGVYLFLNRIMKNIFYRFLNVNLQMYSGFYQLYNDPLLPFDYIETAIHFKK